jgi:hypothetical protein
VASSEATRKRLEGHGIVVFDLNDVDQIPVYVDGADEINAALQMIKGGGGALTREKIVAAVAGNSSALPMHRNWYRCSAASRCRSKSFRWPLATSDANCRGSAATHAAREGFVTDNGNLIVDVHGLEIVDASDVGNAHQPDRRRGQQRPFRLSSGGCLPAWLRRRGADADRRPETEPPPRRSVAALERPASRLRPAQAPGGT